MLCPHLSSSSSAPRPTATPPSGNTNWNTAGVSEPPIAGQPNAVVVNLTHHGAAPETALDLSALQIAVAYGGQTKTSARSLAHEDSTGEFIAPLIPMLSGVYTSQSA